MPCLNELLEERHEVILQWVETRRARGPEGNMLSAVISARATVHDCVNMQRSSAFNAGMGYLVGQDAMFLEHFIEIHGATVVEQ